MTCCMGNILVCQMIRRTGIIVPRAAKSNFRSNSFFEQNRAGHAVSSCPGSATEILGILGMFSTSLHANKKVFTKITYLYYKRTFKYGNYWTFEIVSEQVFSSCALAPFFWHEAPSLFDFLNASCDTSKLTNHRAQTRPDWTPTPQPCPPGRRPTRSRTSTSPSTMRAVRFR